MIKNDIKDVKKEFDLGYFIGQMIGVLVAAPVFILVYIVKAIFLLIVSIFNTKTSKKEDVKHVDLIDLPVRVDEVFEAALCFGQVTGNGWNVSILGYENKFERILKTPRERFHWQRARQAFDREAMIPFTMGLAVANNLPFTISGAQTFTKNELSGLKIMVPVHNIVDADPLENMHVQTSTLAVNIEKNDSEAEQKKIQEASGRIQSAGMVEITPEGKSSYKIFSISIRTSDGQMQEFRGKELSEKFQAREFGIGDTVKLICSKVEFMVGRVKRSKNVFAIEVISKGQK